VAGFPGLLVHQHSNQLLFELLHRFHHWLTWKQHTGSTLEHPTNSTQEKYIQEVHSQWADADLDVLHVRLDRGQAILGNEIPHEGDPPIVGGHLSFQVGQVVVQISRATDPSYAALQLARRHQHLCDRIPLHTPIKITAERQTLQAIESS